MSRRAQIINAEKLAARAKELNSHQTHQAHSPIEDNDFGRTFCLSSNLEIIAISYYFNIHLANTPFSYLPGIWSEIGSSDMIQAATLASSLASLDKVVQHGNIMVLARQYYSDALVAANRALQIQELAIQNSTLLSIILLSTFEALTFRRRASRESWSIHIHGLLALLTSRGEQQFEDACGQRLFSHASLYILAHCAQLNIPVPRQLDRLQAYASTVLGPNHFGLRVARLLTGMATLRVTVRGALATEIVRKALDLDDGFAKILDNMPATFASRDVFAQTYLAQTPFSPDKIRLYRSIDDVRRQNALRVFRIRLQEWIFCAFETELRGIIVDAPSPLDPLYQVWHNLRVQALLEFEKLAGDILASVAYFHAFQTESSHASSRFLFWPLLTVAASELCTLTLRESILDTVRTISSSYSTKQAQEALTMLEEGTFMEGW